MRKQSTNKLKLQLKFKSLSNDQMNKLKGGDGVPPMEEERTDRGTIIIVDDINA